jgi:hypothetical protein
MRRRSRVLVEAEGELRVDLPSHPLVEPSKLEE